MSERTQLIFEKIDQTLLLCKPVRGPHLIEKLAENRRRELDQRLIKGRRSGRDGGLVVT